MAYANEVPWHKLGFPVADNLTPKQMLKASKCDWPVEKQAMFLESGIKIPDRYALVRPTDNSILSVVGSLYQPVQNADAFSFFDRFVKTGKMKMETAGSLCGGKYVWALARLEKDVTVGKSDKVRSYLLMMSPHVHGKAMLFQYTAVRVVCWNTLNFALGSSLKGDETAARLLHSREFGADAKAHVRKVLGLADTRREKFEQAAQSLAAKRIKKTELEPFFFEVLKFDPAKAKKKLDGSDFKPRLLAKLVDAFENAPGAQLTTAAGTWWGAVNAVTQVVDHQLGRERDTALASAWFGERSNLKRRALHVALEHAKVA